MFGRLVALCAPLFLALPASPAQAPGAEEPGAQLVLEVTRWADGEPLADAKVAVHWDLRFIHTADAFGKRPGSSVRGQLDGAGRCRLAVPAHKPLLVYVQGGEDTRLARRVVAIALDPGETRTVSIEASPRTIRVRGTVVDPQGEPVPGARVRAVWGSQNWTRRHEATHAEAIAGRDAPEPVECIADDAGRFEFPGLDGPLFLGESKADWVITAGTATMRPTQRLCLVAREVGHEVTGMEVMVAPTRTLHGQVLGPDGAPAEGARVWVSQFHDWVFAPVGIEGVYAMYPTPSGPPRVTGRDGRFAFAELVEGAWTIRARIEGESSQSVQLGTRDETVTLSFERPPEEQPIDLVGRVVDGQGEPVKGAKLIYRRWGVQAVTDAAGQFRIAGFRPEDLGHDLKVHAPGYAVAGLELPDEAAEVARLEFVLEPERVVRGRVVGPDGAPRGGVEIRCRAIEPDGASWPHWMRSAPYSAFDLNQAQADADGRFELRGLWDTAHSLQVVGGGFGGASRLADVVVEAGTEDLVIRVTGRIERDGETVVVPGDGMTPISARVVDAATGEAIPRFSVYPVEHRRPGSRSGHRDLKLHVDDEDGRFHYASLSQGTWAFALDAEGYRRETTQALTFPRTDGAEPVFALGRPTGLQVMVRDRLGQPVDLAVLDVIGVNGTHLAVQTIEPLGITRDGAATLTDLPRGEVVLCVTPPGCFTDFRFPIDLRERRDEVFEVVLPADFTTPRETVEIEVLDAAGAPIARSFQVLAEDADGTIVASWRMTYWEELYGVTPGHDLMSFLKQIPRSEDPIMPFELPSGRFRLTVTNRAGRWKGPEIVVGQGNTPRRLTLRVKLAPISG